MSTRKEEKRKKKRREKKRRKREESREGKGKEKKTENKRKEKRIDFCWLCFALGLLQSKTTVLSYQLILSFGR